MLNFILEIQSEINHSDMEEIIEKISNTLSADEPSKEYDPDSEGFQGTSFLWSDSMFEPPSIELNDKIVQKAGDKTDIKWSGILTLI